MDEAGDPVEPGSAGEIQVRGPGVFEEYWNRPAETRAAFSEGWFRTGDLAVLDDGAYRILGRLSVDIINTGGYKVSALEIEETLRTHPRVADCAVVGLAHREWGEQVAVALILENDDPLELDELRSWAKNHLAPYKVPSRLRCVESLPRTPLGKVVKPKVAALFD